MFCQNYLQFIEFNRQFCSVLPFCSALPIQYTPQLVLNHDNSMSIVIFIEITFTVLFGN